jgi:hypothetical protein
MDKSNQGNNAYKIIEKTLCDAERTGNHLHHMFRISSEQNKCSAINEDRQIDFATR